MMARMLGLLATTVYAKHLRYDSAVGADVFMLYQAYCTTISNSIRLIAVPEGLNKHLACSKHVCCQIETEGGTQGFDSCG